MPQPDFSYLDALAVQYVMEEDPAVRDSLRNELWTGAAAFIKTLQLKCKLMSDEDLTQEIATHLGSMIDEFNSAKGSFLGYIAYSARAVVHNIYRNARPGGFSRRALEGANAIREVQAQQNCSLEEAQVAIFNKLGVGLLLATHIQEALASQDVPTSLSAPYGTSGMTWEDTIESHEAAVSMDRSLLAVDIQTVPSRYSKILQQILDGVSGLHELNFPRTLSLAEKVIVVDTALRLLQAKLSNSPGTHRLGQSS